MNKEISKPGHKKFGRPRIDPDKKAYTRSFSLGKRHYSKIEAYAKKYDIGLSEALRRIIEEMEI